MTALLVHTNIPEFSYNTLLSKKEEEKEKLNKRTIEGKKRGEEREEK